MIAMRDAMRAIQQHDIGDVVLTTETAIWAWEDVLKDENRHLPIPAMSKGSSVALGVALAHPERRVVLWDGDGGLLMNLVHGIQQMRDSNILMFVIYLVIITACI